MTRLLTLLLMILPSAVFGLERPNILLLMAEDLSPRIGAYGDKVAVTPNIDQFANQGVRYTNVFTASGVCAPSRAAIITGMHQESIGAQHMRSHADGPVKYYAVPPTDMKAFPELLRAAGYYTFNREKLDIQFSNIRSGSGPFTLWDSDTSGGVNLDELPQGQPFFGYVNFIATHESGIFAKTAFPKSVTQLLTQLKQISLHWSTEDLVSLEDVKVPPYYPATQLVREDIARQYNNLITLDRQVGEILKQLDESGRADNTIVIWTSDHGDGLPRAKRELFDSGIKVPMIIRWPEKFRPDGVEPGGVSDRLISLVDLAPTFLSLAGAPLPDFHQGVAFAGEAAAPPREYIYAARDRIDEVADRQRAVRDKRFKYIRSYNQRAGGFHLAYRENLNSMQELWRLLDASQLNDVQRQWFLPRPKEMLFDTHSDPHEIRNLANDPTYEAELLRLRGAYETHRIRVPDLSDKEEAIMAERFWSGGIQPVTEVPVLKQQDSRLTLSCSTKGASIGYRLNGGRWQLYKTPITLTRGDYIEAKAIRYGWSESEVVGLSF